MCSWTECRSIQCTYDTTTQTSTKQFLCALPPALRPQWASKTKRLLTPGHGTSF